MKCLFLDIIMSCDLNYLYTVVILYTFVLCINDGLMSQSSKYFEYVLKLFILVLIMLAFDAYIGARCLRDVRIKFMRLEINYQTFNSIIPDTFINHTL